MGLLASIGTILGAMVVVSVVAIAIRRLVAPERSPMMKRDIFFDFIILGFAIVVGLVIVVEFEAFSDAQRSAETEAESVWLTVQEAKALRVAERDRVQRVAICYGRSVVEDDWDELATGSRSQKTNAIATSAYDELARLRTRASRIRTCSTRSTRRSMLGATPGPNACSPPTLR